VEETQEQHAASDDERHVARADDDPDVFPLPPRVAQRLHKCLGRTQVLDNVQQQHVIERARIDRNLAAVQIRQNKIRDDEIRDVCILGWTILIDAGNIAALVEQSASDIARCAPDIGNF